MKHIISGDQLAQALIKAGIIPENTRRVVIDITAGQAARLYVEEYGTEALLDLIPPNIEGAEIIVNGERR